MAEVARKADHRTDGVVRVQLRPVNVFFLQVEHIAMVHHGLQLGGVARFFLATKKMLNLFSTLESTHLDDSLLACWHFRASVSQ